MLRALVLALLLANAGYYAWTLGAMRAWGLAPTSDTEPQRLQQQLHPEQLRLLDDAPQAAAAGTTAAPKPADPTPGDAPTNGQPLPDAAPTSPLAEPAPATVVADAGTCLQASGLDEAQAAAVRQALAAWPPGSWQLDDAVTPERWMVYIGRLADEDALTRKRAELRGLKVDVDRPGSTWEPGLSLGRYGSEQAAQRALQQLAGQGVRGARVLRERATQTRSTLRLPAPAAGAQRPALEPVQQALAGQPLRACD